MRYAPISSTLDAPRRLPPLPSMERLRELWFDAARTGCDDVIPALLSAGVGIDIRDVRGRSALVLASYGNRASTTALLIDQGASIDDMGDERGNTALMGVAFKGFAPIARMLIDAGAQVDRRNGAGQTALMMAALFDKTAIVDMLVDAGADIRAADAVGNTARTLASSQGNAAMADHLDALVAG